MFYLFEGEIVESEEPEQVEGTSSAPDAIAEDLPQVAEGSAAPVALLAAPSSESEVIDYSVQIGYILDCNIAILICLCFITIFQILERFFKS